MARGRVRLVTIGKRSHREADVLDNRFISLGPLKAASCQQVAMSIGLDAGDAANVANLTEGFPGLARELAKALLHGTGNESLVERVRGHYELGPTLATLLPDGDADFLGVVALFERIGYDGDLGGELSIVCEHFRIDETKLRIICDRETGRFVSRAGSFRRVSPRLFAIWLADQFIQRHGEAFAEALTHLPPSLMEQLVEGTTDLAGDPRLASTFSDLLIVSRFQEGSILDLSPSDLTLIRVASTVSPEAAAPVVSRLIDGATDGELRTASVACEQLTRALEILIWFPEFYELAADSLLRLGIIEEDSTERRARDVLVGSFGVVLGGTGAPYRTRLQWARGQIDGDNPEKLSILVDAFSAGLSIYEMRGNLSFGGRTAPPEWKPQTYPDEMDARFGVWSELVRVAKEFPAERPHVASILASAIPSVWQRGLGDQILEDLPTIEWSAESRASLGVAISLVGRHSELQEAQRVQLERLRSELGGTTLMERLEFLFNLDPWELDRPIGDGSTSEREPVLATVLGEISSLSNGDVVEIARSFSSSKLETLSVLFEKIALERDDESLLAELQRSNEVPAMVCLGYFNGLSRGRSASWSESVLSSWLSDERLAPEVTRAASYLPANDVLAQLATDSVDNGSAVPSVLGLFLYGAWSRGISASACEGIVRRIGLAEGPSRPSAVEHGLGILDQWLGSHEVEVPASLIGAGIELVRMTQEVEHSSSSMTSLYRTQVLKRLNLDPTVRLQLTIDLLKSHGNYLEGPELELLDIVAQQIPDETVRSVIALVSEESTGAISLGHHVGSVRLISRLGNITSTSLVFSAIKDEVPREKWSMLIDHVDMVQGHPDPILVEMLSVSEDPELLSKASFALRYPDSSFGSHADQLDRSLTRAMGWRETSDSESFNAWLEAAIGELEVSLAAARAFEEGHGWQI
jgi:hypothetical protein